MPLINYTKTELLDIYESSEKLSEEIIKSNGYVLSLLEKENLYPKIENLLENFNILSLYFIDKNYTLSNEQKKELNKYYEISIYEEPEIEMTEKEIIEIFENDESLNFPKSTILSKDIINKYKNKIFNEIDKMNENIDTILTNSVKKLNKEDVMSLDSDFFKRNRSLFKELSHFYTDINFKNFYIKIIKENYEKIGYYNFDRFPFEKEDKELLEKYLSTRSFDFVDFNKLLGATKAIDKWDFYKKYSNLGLQNIPLNEVKENIVAIKEAFNNPKFQKGAFYELLKINMSFEQFENIIDENIVRGILRRTNESLQYGYLNDTGNSEDKKKSQLLTKLFIKEFINDEDLIKKNNLSALNMLVNNLEDYSDIPDKKDILIKMYNQHLNSDNFLNMSNLSIINEAFNNVDIDKLNPSINLLYLTLLLQKEIDNSEKVIEKILPNLHEESANLLLKLFDYVPNNKIIYKNTADNSFNNNFLNYKNIEIENINKDVVLLLLQINENFKKHVIENSIRLENLEYRFLNNSSSLPNDFILEYIKLHEEVLVENQHTYNLLISEPSFVKVLKTDIKKLDEKNYEIAEYLFSIISEIFPLVEEQKKSKDYHQNLNHLPQEIKDDILIAIKEKKLMDYLNNNPEISKWLWNINDYIKNRVSDINDSLSKDFKQKKYNQLIKDNNFSKLNQYNPYDFSELMPKFWDNVLSYDFNTLINQLDNKDFVNVMLSYTNERMNRSYQEYHFSDYTAEQNYMIAKKLLPFFPSNSKKDMFNLFSEKNLNTFEKRFVIDFIPEKLFHSSEINAKEYSNEQIIEAYTNIKGIFSKADYLGPQLEFFVKKVYADDEEKYLEMLKLTEDNYPILYLALINFDIARKYEEKRWELKNPNVNKYEPELQLLLDKLATEYIFKNFKFDKLMVAIKETINDIENKENEIITNSTIRGNVIFNMVTHTTYGYSNKNKNGYMSPLSIEQTEELITLLVEKAPFLLYSVEAIGKYSYLPEDLSINLNKFSNVDNIIDSLVFPNKVFSPTVYNEYSTRFVEYRELITEGLINYYVQTEDLNGLNYLNYIIEQGNFFEKINDNYESEFIFSNEMVKSIVERPLLIDMVNATILKVKLDNKIQKVNTLKKSSKI